MRTGRWLLLSALLIGLIGVMATAFLFIRPAPISTPTVRQFAYDSLNSASVRSQVHSGRSLSLQKIELNGVPENASNYFPLFLDHNAHGDREHVLLFSSVNDSARAPLGIFAYSLDEKRVIWRHEMAKPKNAFMALARDQKTLFFLNRSSDSEDPGVDIFRHQMVQLDLFGGEKKRCAIDLAPLFARRSVSEAVEKRLVHCKTALALRESGSGKSLYFGCSVAAPGDSYGQTHGLTGLVGRMDTDAKGELDCQSTKFFETSRWQAGKTLGYDTGVYLFGSKPALLDDGSLLVATGNGPVDFREGNFGCSVLRLNPDLTVKKTAAGEPMAFSRFGDHSRECWESNIEYASSSVAVGRAAGRPIAAVVSKDGAVAFFDPDRLNGQREVSEFEDGGMTTYAQPAVQQLGDEARFFFLLAGATPYDGKESLPANEPATAGESTCLGYLASEKTRDDLRELRLYYSGDMLRDHGAAPADSPLEKELLGFSLEKSLKNKKRRIPWTPFRLAGSLGFLAPSGEAALAILPAHQREHFQAVPWPENETFLDYVNAPAARAKSTPLFFLRAKAKGDTCGHAPTGFKPLYKTERVVKKAGEAADALVAYRAGAGGVRREWRFSLAQNERVGKMHPVVSTDHEGRRPLVVFTVEVSGGQKSRSDLLLVDGDTGKLVARTPFRGRMHFAMPLVFDEFIVLPTETDGLQVFRVE